MVLPDDEAAIVGLGVPCGACSVLVYRQRQGGHRVDFGRVEGEHWAAGITATCERVG
jgi:hypothetical protein